MSEQVHKLVGKFFIFIEVGCSAVIHRTELFVQTVLSLVIFSVEIDGSDMCLHTLACVSVFVSQQLLMPRQLATIIT